MTKGKGFKTGILALNYLFSKLLCPKFASTHLQRDSKGAESWCGGFETFCTLSFSTCSLLTLLLPLRLVIHRRTTAASRSSVLFFFVRLRHPIPVSQRQFHHCSIHRPCHCVVCDSLLCCVYLCSLFPLPITITNTVSK